MKIEGLAEPILYHYTPYPAFRSIVENNQLWLTHYRDAKDNQEIKFGLGLVEEEVKRRFSNVKDGTIASMFDVQKHIPTEDFIFSLCGDPNNDHLWENYGDKHRGVAIGFDAEYFGRLSICEPRFISPVNLLPVDYNVEKFKEIVKDKFERVTLPAFYVVKRECLTKPTDLNIVPNYTEAKFTISECCAMAMMLKNPQYISEKEWRLIHSPNIGHWELAKSRVKGKLRAIWAFDDLLPIKKIILGNKCKTPENETRKFLSKHGYSPDLIEQNQILMPAN